MRLLGFASASGFLQFGDGTICYIQSEMHSGTSSIDINTLLGPPKSVRAVTLKMEESFVSSTTANDSLFCKKFMIRRFRSMEFIYFTLKGSLPFLLFNHKP